MLISDVHFSLNPPVWRSPEKDWFDAMHRPFEELAQVCGNYQCPLVISGDINDRWNSTPELINFMIGTLKMFRNYGVWAVPGQHDLPHHRRDDIHKTAYWTLVKSGSIQDIGPKESHYAGKHLRLTGFPWGTPIEPQEKDATAVNVAVIHDYCWEDGHSFPNAPVDKHWSVHRNNLTGFDVAAFGDNHSGFVINSKTGCKIVNCGTMMRRTSAEKDYHPFYTVLAKIEETPPGCHLIKIPYKCKHRDVTLGDVDNSVRAETLGVVSDFMSIMEGLGEDIPDYREACRRYMRVHNTPKNIQRIVLEIVESCMQDEKAR